MRSAIIGHFVPIVANVKGVVAWPSASERSRSGPPNINRREHHGARVVSHDLIASTSRGGRSDLAGALLAGARLAGVTAPTLLIVGALRWRYPQT